MTVKDRYTIKGVWFNLGLFNQKTGDKMNLKFSKTWVFIAMANVFFVIDTTDKICLYSFRSNWINIKVFYYYHFIEFYLDFIFSFIIFCSKSAYGYMIAVYVHDDMPHYRYCLDNWKSIHTSTSLCKTDHMHSATEEAIPPAAVSIKLIYGLLIQALSYVEKPCFFLIWRL